MIKQTIAAIFLSITSTLCFASTVIDNSHPCTMKDLPVICENGDKINLDVIRSTDQRGDIFLNINTKDNLGNYVMLYIDNKQPEVLKIENGTNTVNISKGAFIPRNIILKLRNATSVYFKIGMEKRTPISGHLEQNHFDWLKRFGNACS